MNKPNTCSSNHTTTLASLKDSDSAQIVIVPVNIPRVKQQSVPKRLITHINMQHW